MGFGTRPRFDKLGAVLGRRARLAVGQPTEVVVDGRPHVAFVLESSLVVPAKDNSGLAEGTCYFLEYVVTPK